MKQNDFTELVHSIGEAGISMTEINAAEGSAGNISVFVRDLRNMDRKFYRQGEIRLPVKAPALAGGWVLISGTGQRLRDLGSHPESTLCVLQIAEGGEQAILWSGIDLRPTSEFNSHLAVHNDHVARRALDFHVIVHAQPLYLTYLSHIARYASPRELSCRLLRWHTETVVYFPEGIGVVPFQVPGSEQQMKDTAAVLQCYRLAVWPRHGVIARSDEGVQKAGDLVEYAETAAHYEYLNLQAGEPSGGLSEQDLKFLSAQLGVPQTIF